MYQNEPWETNVASRVARSDPGTNN